MERNIGRLSRDVWDVLVVGGGIHGAFIAREAALRGLSVALVEKGDFASATSSHSQKIVHSGVRYLQHGDLVRLRQSLRERTVLSRIAPHLVGLLPVLVPAYGHGRKGPELLSAGLAFHDLMGLDRNRGLGEGRDIPRGRIVSAAECRRLFPEVDGRGLTGGALWYDGQIRNTERFILALLHDAARGGAALANYVEVTGFTREGARITGAEGIDGPTGRNVDIRAQVVVNATGPWLGRLCRLAGALPPKPEGLSRAVVLVVRRPLVKEVAVGLPGRKAFRDTDVLLPRGQRFFFVTPWRGRALVGSAHLPFDGDPGDCAVEETEVEEFLADVNEACPAWAIGRDDVTFVYRGLLPTAGTDEATGSIRVEKRQRVVDHRREGLEGLISVLGVKYTTARDAAVRTVDLAGRTLGKALPATTSESTPLHGGGRIGAVAPEKGEEALFAALPDETKGHLAATYGTAAGEVLSCRKDDPRLGEQVCPSSPVIAAEIVHGIRREMALTLSDLVLRRTELGSAGHPGSAALERCAELAAGELGWDGPRIARELEEMERAFPGYR